MPSDQFCSFTSCEKEAYCRTLCKAHYTQLCRGQDLRPTLDMLSRVCKVDGCKKPVRVVRDQLCQSHYDRSRRGTLDGLVPRPCVVCGAVFTPVRRANTQCCSDACSGRNARLKQKYGIDGAQLVEMLEAQGGECPICARNITADTLHVDHDHQTGAVRALLCAQCNMGLGQFNDEPARLIAAASYLLEHHNTFAF